MLALSWITGRVRRQPLRLLGVAAGVALAVALLASLGLFLDHSKSTMTARSIADIGVDWQVQITEGADPASVEQIVSATQGVTTVLPVGFATSPGLRATTGSTTQATGTAQILGFPDGYTDAFPAELRSLSGATSGVLVAQQTAANLHVAPGDTVTVERPGLTSIDLRVDGVVDLLTADSLFQTVGAPPSVAPAAPPDNVVIVPAATWHDAFDPLAASGPGSVRTQLHVGLDHHLPTDPNVAYNKVGAQARNLEARLAGTATVGDNLAARLSGARSDALYAQVLFVFLGLPGAVLAALLTASVASAGAERRRAEQALLRTRGATARVLVALAATEAAVIAAAGAAVGLLAAAGVARLTFDGASFSTSSSASIWWAGPALFGTIVALLTVVVPAWRDARRLTASDAHRLHRSSKRPVWIRYGLDLVLIAGGLVALWVLSRGGYQIVLAPEGVSTVSVDYWAFVAPGLLWIGAGLLTWRLAELALRRGRPMVARASRPVAGPLAATAAASMTRRRRVIAHAVVLIALTVAFAISTATFNATYRRQAEVDALLTNGADVTVAAPPSSRLTTDSALRLSKVDGVRNVEPMQHRYAYVGADLQDLYGVRATTIAQATHLQDSYFQGASASQALQQLAAAPDSLLVSAETANDYQLVPGDLVRLRLRDARTGQYTEVPFHYVAVAKEFPTAPKDSFLVANADYIAEQTHDATAGTYLLDTGGAHQAAVAERVRSVVGTDATVTDLQASRRSVGSSLTSVDLAGLTRVELGFALLLVLATTALVLALGLAERRRTFAITRALGARASQIGGLIWTEAGFVVGCSLLLGAATGWALARVLTSVLTGVFDPPPTGLTIPWPYLGLLLAAAISAAGAVAATAVTAIRRSSIVELSTTFGR